MSYEARVAMSEDLVDVVMLSTPGTASVGLGVVVLVVGLSGLLLMAATTTTPVVRSLAAAAKPSSKATGAAPEVTPSERQPRGYLGKEVIRQVIRRHLNEVKRCYEEASAEKPDFSRRFMLKFTISADGAVVASAVERTTMTHDSTVPACVSQAVRRWKFPKPEGGGIVIVSYPFWFCGAGSD